MHASKEDIPQLTERALRTAPTVPSVIEYGHSVPRLPAVANPNRSTSTGFDRRHRLCRRFGHVADSVYHMNSLIGRCLGYPLIDTSHASTGGATATLQQHRPHSVPLLGTSSVGRKLAQVGEKCGPASSGSTPKRGAIA